MTPVVVKGFAQKFVAKTCRAIIDDVEKLDAIQDGFIHCQLLRSCQATRLQYIDHPPQYIILDYDCQGNRLSTSMIDQ